MVAGSELWQDFLEKIHDKLFLKLLIIEKFKHTVESLHLALTMTHVSRPSFGGVWGCALAGRALLVKPVVSGQSLWWEESSWGGGPGGDDQAGQWGVSRRRDSSGFPGRHAGKGTQSSWSE